MNVQVIRLEDSREPPARLRPALEAGVAEGVEFVERLERDWRDGSNRFDAPGEAFLVACRGDVTVGFAGLNRDPFTANLTTGRLRHVYVVPAARRVGVGDALVRSVLEAAIGSFERVRLRTSSPDADRFYRALGFERIDEDAATHSIVLRAGP